MNAKVSQLLLKPLQTELLDTFHTVLICILLNCVNDFNNHKLCYGVKALFSWLQDIWAVWRRGTKPDQPQCANGIQMWYYQLFQLFVLKQVPNMFFFLAKSSWIIKQAKKVPSLRSDEPVLKSLAPFTQRRHIITPVVVRQFPADGYSHRAKHLQLQDEPLCNSHRKPALQLLKRCDLTRHDNDVGVFSRCFPGVLLSI